MMRSAHRRRTGTSLMEVLVGFGILGIGVASVISLYPFAALAAGNALIKDRTTTSALIADGQLREIHKRFVVEVGERSKESEQYCLALDSGAGGAQGVPADSSEPSYPVFIDPIGLANNLLPASVGTAKPATNIPRVNLSLIQNSSGTTAERTNLALRYCSQMDGLGYNEDGAVVVGPEMRELRYNWLWVVQRPVNRDRYNLRMQVVVFNQRIHQYRPSMTERSTTTTLTVGQTSVPLASTDPLLTDVRKGTWLMDAGNTTNPLRHAEFYRVVSVADSGALELHRPVQSPHGLDPGTRYSATLVLIPGIADVYERPLLNAGYGP